MEFFLLTFSGLKRNIKATFLVQSVTNSFLPSLQACQSSDPSAVRGQRKPGLYKPQGMTCMVGLTVSSQEKSRVLFWSKNLNSSSPRQSKTRMSTESHAARAKYCIYVCVCIHIYKKIKNGKISDVSKCLRLIFC